MGWRGRWEGGSGWGTHVHLWQIHVNVWQNQYNIVISLQLNKFILKKKKEYWSGLPFPSPGNLPDTGIKTRSLALQEDSLPNEPPEKSNVDTGVFKTRILTQFYVLLLII